MTTTDRAKNSAQQAKDKAKETGSKATGNDKLRAEGYAEMDRNLKEAGLKN
jgi:uncharacterized protein YjbJ (UPF0337 family)